ncbi:D5 family helicase-primase [Marseillevirus Shanghai 1]|uniref:DNA primase n=1 Tax=Melbournevirus TaxID=1560514 RepID=UPI00051F5526|nr:DNA primase [Melbournevirus]AIT54749.1 primase [Melbournevirus]AVR52866.1 D5 family helicase-primase [Marseillevirus Shanghai 1]
MAAKRQSRDIFAFLDSFRVAKGIPCTHTSFSPSGRYAVEGAKNLKAFFEVYNNAVENGVTLCITEMPYKYHPLYVDVDFRFKDSGKKMPKRKYTKEHVVAVIRAYQNVIRVIVPEFDQTERMLSCLVLERSSPRLVEEQVKDGFHLFFPFFIVASNVQNVFMRQKVVKELVETGAFKDLEMLETEEKCIDSLKGKPWLMYGSTKPGNLGDFLEPYTISQVYSDELEEIDVDSLLGEEADEMDLEIPKDLPYILSIQRRREPTPIVRGIIPSEKKMTRRKRPARLTKTVDQIMADIAEVRNSRVLDMLDGSRAENYDDWMNVGWTLFNIGNGLPEALELWIDFSSRASNFDEKKCEYLWDTMEMKGKSIGSLYQMAKNDNPEKYNDWKKEKSSEAMKGAMTAAKPTHANIASLIHIKYSDRFVCADSKANVWYEFRGHRWHKMDDANELMRIISFELPEEFRVEINRLSAITGQSQDPNSQLTIKKCVDIQSKLQMDGFSQGVMKMCKRLFLNEHFLSKLDENRDLLGMEDGVCDLKLGIFRDGSPDDYISMSTGISYKALSEEDRSVIECREFLKKLFPNPRIRKCALRMVSSCMQGGNRNKRIYICTGKGNNGKSVFFSLLEYIFGQYLIKFPREMCLAGRAGNPSSARPELARAPGTRYGVIQEVHKNEKFNPGILKELSGNDSFFVRNLFEKGRDIKPMFTIFMMANKPPGVPGSDQATWNRIRLIPFEATFLSEQDENWIEDPELRREAKMFKADEHFEEKIPGLAHALLWLCVEDFRKYKEEGLCEPEEVEAATAKMRARNDTIRKYIRDCLIVDREKKEEDDEKTFLTVSELFNHYKEWHDENFPSYAVRKTMTILKFRKQFARAVKIQPINGKKFEGLSFKEQENLEDDEGKGDEDF